MESLPMNTNASPVCTYPTRVPYCRLTIVRVSGGSLKEIHASCIPLQCKSAGVSSKRRITVLDSDAVTYCK